jgi:hemerythrin-like domain-containing protein
VLTVARRTRRIAVQSVVAGMALSVAAMGLAFAGLLPAVFGALLQEAIDVVVILNALRALGSGDAMTELAPELMALTRRFRDEHDAIRTDIEELRGAADCLGFVPPAEAMDRVRRLHKLLVGEVGPHEAAEERELYPRLDRQLGLAGATATMSRAHAEIAHQIRRLGQLLEEIGTDSPDDADIADLRALLYGLWAILKLHTLQEEESYLSLADESGHEVTASGSAAVLARHSP